MTLGEIITNAVNHLEYGDYDAFYDKFVIYANSAISIIANDIKLTRTDTVTLHPCNVGSSMSSFDINSDLQKDCTKIISVSQNGTPVSFKAGSSFSEILVDAADMVEVKYRYIPDNIRNADDVPDIPSLFHPIIYLFIVHCHYNTRSSSSDYDRTKWLQEFNAEKHRRIKLNYGVPETYRFKNYPY